MSLYKRRDFLKLSSLCTLPIMASAATPMNAFAAEGKKASKDSEAVYFINAANAIERDNYGEGGTIEQLLKKFIEITGKEAAYCFRPSKSRWFCTNKSESNLIKKR